MLGNIVDIVNAYEVQGLQHLKQKRRSRWKVKVKSILAKKGVKCWTGF
jgi:hypothetical protein